MEVKINCEDICCSNHSNLPSIFVSIEFVLEANVSKIQSKKFSIVPVPLAYAASY